MALVTKKVEMILSGKDMDDKVRKMLNDTKMITFDDLKTILLGWTPPPDIRDMPF